MTATTGTPATKQRKVGRLERTALAGIMTRELTMFGYYWRSNTFSSIVEPTVYLLAFGLGMGALLPVVAGYAYIEFIGTGIVAMTAMFSTAFPAMFGTFVKRKFQHTYDAVLAAPVDTEEVVTGEALWLASKGGVYGMAPLIVTMFFGLEPSWGMLLVPFIAFATGFGWACAGIAMSAIVPSIDSFNYVVSAVITPLFLVAGTFFPIENMPPWAEIASNFNPLFHTVQLVRGVVFGLGDVNYLLHVGALLLFGLLTWRLAIKAMERVLID